MEKKYLALIWISLFLCITVVACKIIHNQRDYNTKIVSISRHTYRLEFENGKPVFFVKDIEER